MLELFANNAHGTIAAGGITNVATTLNLNSGEGASFPSPGSGEFFRFEMEDAGLTTFEACYCTARSGDVLTIERGKDGTSASAFAADSRVRHRPTDEMLNSILGIIERESPLPFTQWMGLGSASFLEWGGRALNHAGTISLSGVSAASMLASLHGLINTATLATQVCGPWFGQTAGRLWMGNDTNRGGFDVWIAFGLITNVASTFAFVGLDDDAGTFAQVTPGSRTTIAQCAFGFDTSSGTGSNWQLFHSSGVSGTVTAHDTGMVRNTTDAYIARFYSAPNSQAIQATLYNMATGESYTFTVDSGSGNVIPNSVFLVSYNLISGAIGAAIKSFGMWRFAVNQSEPTV